MRSDSRVGAHFASSGKKAPNKKNLIQTKTRHQNNSSGNSLGFELGCGLTLTLHEEHNPSKQPGPASVLSLSGLYSAGGSSFSCWRSAAGVCSKATMLLKGRDSTWSLQAAVLPRGTGEGRVALEQGKSQCCQPNPVPVFHLHSHTVPPGATLLSFSLGFSISIRKKIK